MSNQTYRLKITEIGHLGKNTSIHTDLGIPPKFHGPDESLSTRDSHIAFAMFYVQQARFGNNKTPEQIYAMWQEKSSGK